MSKINRYAHAALCLVLTSFAGAAGGINSFADAVTAVLGGQTYVNVHTMANPGGEVRGHIGPATINGVLSGGQELPPVTTVASGSVVIKLNGTQDQLDVTLDAGT